MKLDEAKMEKRFSWILGLLLPKLLREKAIVGKMKWI